MDYVNVTILGNLTKDVEGKLLKNKQFVFNSAIAANPHKKGEPIFFDLIFWGDLGQNAKLILAKGSHALINGSLTTSTWEHEGKKNEKLIVTVKDFRNLSPRTKQTKS